MFDLFHQLQGSGTGTPSVSRRVSRGRASQISSLNERPWSHPPGNGKAFGDRPDFDERTQFKFHEMKLGA